MYGYYDIYYHVESVKDADRLRDGDLLTKEHLLPERPLFLSKNEFDWWPSHLPDADKNFRLYEIGVRTTSPLLITSTGTGEEHFNNEYFKLFKVTGGDPKNIEYSEHYFERYGFGDMYFFGLLPQPGEIAEYLLYKSDMCVETIKLIKGPKPKYSRKEIEAKVALAGLLEPTNLEVAKSEDHIEVAYIRHPTGDLENEDVIVMYSDPKHCTGEGVLLKVSFQVYGQVKYTDPEETEQEFLDKVLITDEPELRQSNWCKEVFRKYYLNLLTKGTYNGCTLYVLLYPDISVTDIEEMEETSPPLPK